MFGGSKKRSRLVLWEGQRRAALQGSPDERWERRRALLARLGVGLATVLVLSLIVQSGGGNWGPPYPYRVDQVYGRDIRVKIEFKVEDEAATRHRKDQAAAAAPTVFRLDVDKFKELQLRLTQLCLAARSGEVNRLDPATLVFWALRQEDLKALQQRAYGSAEQSAAGILFTPGPSLGAAEVQLLAVLADKRARDDKELLQRIQTAFDNLAIGVILDDKEKGVLDEVKAGPKFVIRRAGDAKDKEGVLLEHVLKAKLTGQPAGGKGSIYRQFFNNAFEREPETAELLYHLVVGSEARPSRLPATLTFDRTATERARQEARDAEPRQEKEYKQGMPLVDQGTPITEQDLTLLRAEHKAYLASLSAGDHLRRWFSLLVVIGLLAAFVGLYIRRVLPDVAESLPQLLSVCVLIIVGLGTAVFSQSLWGAAIVPLTMTAMILALAFDQPFALIVTFSMSLIMTVALGTDIGHLLVLIGGLTVAVLLLRDVRSRSRLAQVGFLAGVTYAAMTVAVGLLTEQTWTLIGYDLTRRFFWGLFAGIFLGGILPFIEKALGMVTDISLLELSDVSHPLLQELVRRAPGTYTHSITVATLAEGAAEAIGANTLLTRVGAYFHDIGKMLKPHYFVENQTGENRHEGLAPAMSTLIIIGHVKDGAALGRQHRLPEPIIDFIEQHHGTTLVEYFYREAAKSLDPGQSNGELEASFRYPGPKPQSREIGVVMLADAVEGASRALNEPNPGSIKKLVHDLLLKRLLDGQFDESGLTLSELHLIEDSLCKSLIAIFHARIKYPEAKTAS